MAKTLQDLVDEALQDIREVSVSEASELIKSGDYIVLDVREADEFEAGHIPGAMLVPRGFLEVRADLTHHKRDVRLEDRTQKVLCFCGGGYRSALAAQTLKQMGFENPLSIAGGWTAWNEVGLPVSKD